MRVDQADQPMEALNHAIQASSPHSETGIRDWLTITATQARAQRFLAERPAQSLDYIFADPPYGTGNTHDKRIHYRDGSELEAQNWTPFFADWDGIPKSAYLQFSMSWLYGAYRALRPGGGLTICGTLHGIPKLAIALEELGFYQVQWMYWYQRNAMPHRAHKQLKETVQVLIWAEKPGGKRQFNYHESLAYGAQDYGEEKNLHNMWDIPQDMGHGRWLMKTYGVNHESKKPRALLERCLRLFVPQDRSAEIADPFSGTGVTAWAAELLHREQPLTIHLNDALPKWAAFAGRRFAIPVTILETATAEELYADLGASLICTEDSR